MRYLYRIVSRSKIRYFYQPFRTFIRISRGRNRNAAVEIFNLSRNWTVRRLYPSRKLATPSRIEGPIWHLLDNTMLENPKDNKRNLISSVMISYVILCIPWIRFRPARRYLSTPFVLFLSRPLIHANEELWQHSFLLLDSAENFSSNFIHKCKLSKNARSSDSLIHRVDPYYASFLAFSCN